MKKILSPQALSLMELIISTAVVSIMVLGITSSQMAMQRASQGYGANYILGNTTRATIDHILNNARFAIGSGVCPRDDATANDDIGILVPNNGLNDNPPVGETTDQNSVCFHQDISPAQGNVSATSALVNNTPDDMTDDRWLCYTMINTTTFRGIVYAAQDYANGNARRVPDGLPLPVMGSTFLGAASSLTTGFNIDCAPPNQQLSLQFSLVNCLFIAGTNGLTCDPNVKTIQQLGVAFPPGHSM